MSTGGELIDFKEKMRIGRSVSDSLFRLGMELASQLPKAGEVEETKTNIICVAKAFLITASQLSGQIMAALSEGKLSLSIIGLKTLLEFNINANYIYDHPEHKQGYKWAHGICEDIFKRTNDLGMLKNRLGGVSLEERARAIERVDLYKVNYAALCDFAHLMLRQPSLNRKETFERLTIDAISHALCDLVGVLDSIKNYFGLNWNQTIEDEVISFRDRFEMR